MTLREYLLKNYSESSLYANLYNIRRFTGYYPNGQAKNATYMDIINYLEYLRKYGNLHPKTLKHCLYAVKIYFNFLLETGVRKDHPCSEVNLKDNINKQIQVDKLYSEQTLEHFFETACQSRRKHRLDNRNRIIVSLLVYQALTVSEIVNLTLEDINLDKGEILIREQCHQRMRILPLKAKQIMLFYAYLQQDHPKLLAFAKKCASNKQTFILGQYGEKLKPFNISKIINEYRPQSEQIKPMRIRQSVIANLLKKENDARIVQVFAGHKRVSTTEQYRQNELEALKTAVTIYHPIK